MLFSNVLCYKCNNYTEWDCTAGKQHANFSCFLMLTLIVWGGVCTFKFKFCSQLIFLYKHGSLSLLLSTIAHWIMCHITCQMSWQISIEDGTRVLKKAMQGENVRRIQFRLKTVILQVSSKLLYSYILKSLYMSYCCYCYCGNFFCYFFQPYAA